MRVTRMLVAVVVALGAVLGASGPAAAEWFADVFVGGTFTTSDDVRINDGIVGRRTIPDVDFETGLAWGGRFGHYFEAVPYVGVAVDLLYFSANMGESRTGSIDVDATSVAPYLMLRLPLVKTAAAPKGMVQPYVGAGLPLVLTNVTPREGTAFRNHHSDTGVSVGYAVAGGVAVQVYKNLALFAEYRFSHAPVDVDLEDGVGAGRASLRTDLNSHSTLVGISARW